MVVEGTPLKGIKVLDLTNNLPGPYCTQILGDLGAEIIKIENINGGDQVRKYPPFKEGESILFQALNRNKKSVALDLKQKEGLEIYYKLVKKVDVIVDSFLPSTSKKLKINYDKVKMINSKIIYTKITGYGDNTDIPVHDLNVLGQSGILSISGPKDKPIQPGIPIVDLGGGALPAVIAILAAIISKKGQFLDISMQEQIMPWLVTAIPDYLKSKQPVIREEHALSGYIPFYSIFLTSDNEFFSFAPLEKKFWLNFCMTIQREDLIDSQYDFFELGEELPKIFKGKTAEEWEKIFVKAALPGSKVLTIEESLTKYSNSIMTLNHPKMGEITLFSPTFGNRQKISLPPLFGQHSREILRKLGYSNDEITNFSSKSIIPST